MPVIVDATHPHPFLPSSGDPAAIEAERARRQDIRPMRIAIINLMADKMATEKQLAAWLGNTALQVEVTFVAPDEYVLGIRAGRASRHTPPTHIRNIYKAFSEIKPEKFDGVIITGVNALEPTVEAESFWPAVREIIEWSDRNVLSSLYLCWGGMAALKHFHNINSFKGAHKNYGVFDNHVVNDKSGLLAGLPDIFPVPVGRWKSPDAAAIRQCPALEIVAETAETGPDILAESAPYDSGAQFYPRRVYVFNHPEYETETLQKEYQRDCADFPDAPMPKNYFPDNNPAHAPRNTWRHSAHLYTNWVKAIYEATPYDIEQIPNPFWRKTPESDAA